MTVLTKDQILAASDLPFEEVNVPEWDGKVRLKTLTENELGEYESPLIGKSKSEMVKSIRLQLCVLVIVDDKGNRVFNEFDMAELSKKSSLAMDRVFSAAQRMNGLGKKYIDDMVKNSDPDTESDSNTD